MVEVVCWFFFPWFPLDKKNHWKDKCNKVETLIYKTKDDFLGG